MRTVGQLAVGSDAHYFIAVQAGMRRGRPRYPIRVGNIKKENAPFGPKLPLMGQVLGPLSLAGFDW